VATPEVVLKCLGAIYVHSAPGASGLRVPHIKDLVCGRLEPQMQWGHHAFGQGLVFPGIQRG
jgi:hypothetical protein